MSTTGFNPIGKLMVLLLADSVPQLFHPCPYEVSSLKNIPTLRILYFCVPGKTRAVQYVIQRREVAIGLACWSLQNRTEHNRRPNPYSLLVLHHRSQVTTEHRIIFVNTATDQ